MAVEVSTINKFYGKQQVLKNVSFSIKKGEIVGFLGPNGAGKSTTMKILTGYISDFEGIVTISGLDIRTHKIKAQNCIGYLPENNPLYVEMYVKEYLNFNAEIHNIPKEEVLKVIEKVRLTSECHKKIKQLSKGYRQRVGLAAALLHNPEVLILDEPTTGLDPNQLVEIRSLIKQVGKDKIVLFSTHIMQEVEAVCDRVILINKGAIVADKPLDDFKNNNEQFIEVEFDFKVEQQFFKKLKNLKSAQNVFDNTWILHFESEIDMRPNVFDFANKNGLKILSLTLKNKNLERLFQELTV